MAKSQRQRDERKALQNYEEHLTFVNSYMKKTTTTGGHELKRAGKEIFGENPKEFLRLTIKDHHTKRACVTSSIQNPAKQAENIGSRVDQTAQCTTVLDENDMVTCRETPNNSPLTRRIVGNGRLLGCARVMTLA